MAIRFGTPAPCCGRPPAEIVDKEASSPAAAHAARQSRGPDDHLPEVFELRTNRDVDDTRGHRRAIVLGATSPSRTIAHRHPHATLARRVHRERPRAPRRRILVRAELGHDDPIAAPAMRGNYPTSTASAYRTSDSSRPS